jgi:hypothetical protein
VSVIDPRFKLKSTGSDNENYRIIFDQFHDSYYFSCHFDDDICYV